MTRIRLTSILALLVASLSRVHIAARSSYQWRWRYCRCVATRGLLAVIEYLDMQAGGIQ